jgi:trafficking protein particle complex subunit 8
LWLETFWIDVVLRNPLDADVNLSNLTVAVERKIKEEGSIETFVGVEVIDEILLSPGETQTVGTIHYRYVTFFS